MWPAFPHHEAQAFGSIRNFSPVACLAYWPSTSG